MDRGIGKLFDYTGLLIPDYTFVLTAREKVRKTRLQARSISKSLELDLLIQREADRLFQSLGHPIVDTSEIQLTIR